MGQKKTQHSQKMTPNGYIPGRMVTAQNRTVKSAAIGWGIFILLWILLGLIGFVWSITCFWKGDPARNAGWNVGGLLLAVLLGPLWWIYYFAAKSAGYCKSASVAES